MSTKPTTVGTWDSGNVHTTAIAGGHASSGYASNEVPASDELNQVLRLAGLWEQYLSDGDIELKGWTLTPVNKAIANATTNDWDPGTGSLAGILLIAMTGGGASAIITGLSNTGVVDGKTVILRNDTGSTVQLNLQDAGSGLANRFVANDLTTAITIPTNGMIAFTYRTGSSFNKWVMLCSSFVIPTATTRRIQGANATVTGTGSFTYDTTSGGPKTGANTNIFVFPLTLDTREVLNSVSLNYREGNADVITLKLFQYQGGSTVAKTQLGSTQTSSGSHITDAQLTVSGQTAAAGADKAFWVEVACTTFSVGASLDFLEYTTTMVP